MFISTSNGYKSKKKEREFRYFRSAATDNIHLYICTHVYVLQRLKALSDGENEATILHWTLWVIRYTPTAPKCSDR